jgi:hypothetical protein
MLLHVAHVAHVLFLLSTLLVLMLAVVYRCYLGSCRSYMLLVSLLPLVANGSAVSCC